MYSFIREIEMGVCGSGWYGRNWHMMSLLRTGLYDKGRTMSGQGKDKYIDNIMFLILIILMGY